MTDRPDIEHTQILSSRELERAAFQVSTPAPGRYLAVQSGKDLVALPLHPGSITRIGRGLSADVHIDDASVSRRHALITQRGEKTVILDDRSRNGVHVNGARVSEAELRDGDTIVCGHVTLRYVERAE